MYAVTVRLQVYQSRMFRPLLAALVITVSMWVRPCSAEVRDGGALLTQCTATIGAIMDFCYGYIDAVADYMFQKHAMGEFTACVSNAPDDSQLRFVVVKFLKENPDIQQLSASELIARALSAKYPCP
jgi:hypothetical protein